MLELSKVFDAQLDIQELFDISDLIWTISYQHNIINIDK